MWNAKIICVSRALCCAVYVLLVATHNHFVNWLRARSLAEFVYFPMQLKTSGQKDSCILVLKKLPSPDNMPSFLAAKTN